MPPPASGSSAWSRRKLARCCRLPPWRGARLRAAVNRVTERKPIVWGVVYAAGSGTRFGGYKQFERLLDERLVDRCVRVVRAACDGVVVVVPPAFVWDGPPVERAVPGGATNPELVRAGVEAVPAEAEIIVLHSPAHPLATVDLVRAVVDRVAQGADGAICAIPSYDMLKRVDDEGVILETIPKDQVRLVQAPMAFRSRSAAPGAGSGDRRHRRSTDRGAGRRCGRNGTRRVVQPARRHAARSGGCPTPGLRLADGDQ